MARKPQQPKTRFFARSDYHVVLGTWATVVATLTAIVVGYFQITAGANVPTVSADPRPARSRPVLAAVPTPPASRAVNSSRPSPTPSSKAAARHLSDILADVPPVVQVQIAPQPTIVTQVILPVGIRLRAEPNQTANTIAVIEPGQNFLIGERIGDWFYAQLPSGTRGFVRAELVDQRPRNAERSSDAPDATEQAGNRQQ